MRITARAPTRIDLAGGTLDLHPLSLFVPGGLTVNVALSLQCTVELVLGENPAAGEAPAVIAARDGGERLAAPSAAALPEEGPLAPVAAAVKYFDPPAPFRLTTYSPVPRSSGLGASSALLLAACAALNVAGRRLHSLLELIHLTAALEARAAGVPAGFQDQYAAAFGGMSILHWELRGARRERVPLTGADREELGRRLLLTWSGQAHRSGSINWEMFKAYVDRRQEAVAGFHQIAGTARAMADAARQRDWAAVGPLLQQEWEARRAISPLATGPALERLASAAAAAGASGSKACGAGGGGCLLTAVPPGRRDAVKAALEQAGGRVLPLVPQGQGLAVELHRQAPVSGTSWAPGG